MMTIPRPVAAACRSLPAPTGCPEAGLSFARQASRVFRRTARGLLALTAGLTLTACQAESWSTVARPSDGATPSRLALADRFEQQSVFRWDLTVDDEQDQWQLEARAEDDPRPANGIQRRVSLDTETIDSIQITFSGALAGRATLRWAREGYRRTARVSGRVPGGRVTFDLAENRDWRGSITDLFITWSGRKVVRGISGVRTIEGFRRAPDPEHVDAVARGTYRATLRRDERVAWPTTARHPRQWRVQVPPRAALDVAFGLPWRIETPVTFTVRAHPDDEAPTTLWSRKLVPGTDPIGQWLEHRLDLADFADRDLEIGFEVATDHARFGRGFPLWATPRLIVRDPSPPPPNIVVISIDTLRADRLSLYGHDRPTSPNLDRWARREAVVFDRCIAQAPWTLPSHVSMLSGLDAIRHGVNHPTVIPSTLPWLPEHLRSQGYVTAAVVGGGFVDASFGFARGFDSFHRPADSVGSHRPGMRAIVDRAFSWLDRHHDNRPLFLFLHTYEVHGPYEAKLPWLSTVSELPAEAVSGRIVLRKPRGVLDRHDLIHVRPDGTESVLAADNEIAPAIYDSHVAKMDVELKRLLDGLRDRGLGKETLVVFTSDHGEALGEDGIGGHGHLVESNLHVPLVIALPGRRDRGRRVSRQVRSIDLVPTILDAAGLPPLPDLDGRSLLPLGRGGDEAWSYAASTNQGVFLRWQDRVEIRRPLDVWSVLRKNTRGRDLRTDGETSPSLDVVDRLEKHIDDRLEADAAGLRLRLANDGDVPLTGRLGGVALALNAIKSWDLRCRCIHIRGPSIAFTVPPKTTFTLVHESPGTGPLRLTANRKGEGHEMRIDLSRLEMPRGLRWEGDAWHPVSGAEARSVSTGITVWWHARSADAPAPENSELEEQLEALGYAG